MLSRSSRPLALVLGAFVLLGATFAPVRADDDAALDLRYGLYWGGIRIATVELHHELEPADYRFDLEVETVGLVKQITKYRAEASIAGKRERFGSLAPVTYSYWSKARKKSQSAVVEFDPTTGDVVSLDIKKRGEPRGTDVPEAMQRDVIDPLTAFLELRELVAEAHAGGRNRLRAAVFDGRHRYDVQATLTGSERVRIAGRSWPALRVVLDIVPRAGFDNDDLEDLGAEDDELRFAVLFSDDGQMLPLEASTLDSTISGTISLLEDCSGRAGCRMAAR